MTDEKINYLVKQLVENVALNLDSEEYRDNLELLQFNHRWNVSEIVKHITPEYELKGLLEAIEVEVVKLIIESKMIRKLPPYQESDKEIATKLAEIFKK